MTYQPSGSSPHGTVRQRAVVVSVGLLLAYAGAGALLAWSTGGLLATTPRDGGDRLDVLLGLAACAGAWLVLTWLAATSALAVAALLVRADSPLRPLARRVAPLLVRRLAVLALGAGVAGSSVWAALPAVAVAGGGQVSATASLPADLPAGLLTPDRPATVPADLLTPDRPADDLRGWTPDRPAPAPRTARNDALHLVSTAPRAGTSVADEVVVRRGDSLWDIAERHLGPGATSSEVAAEWPRWHAANREVVGDDPDLIRPGQRLSPPMP